MKNPGFGFFTALFVPRSWNGDTMTIGKSTKLNNVRYDIRGPIADEADRLEREGTHIIRLNTGNPAAFGAKIPLSIIESLSENAKTAAAYSNSKGLYKAREAIAGYYTTRGIADITADDVYTGNGVSELIQLSLMAFLNPGDEVLIPTPDYPLWTAATILSGGKAVHYICDEQANWYPDIADISHKITPRTRAIVLISPNNPTGAVYPRDVVEQIAEIARKHKLVVFSDEVYDRVIIDNLEHVSMAAIAPDLLTLVFNGLSKSHNLCGYRVGWMALCGDKSGASEYISGINLLVSLRLCANVTGQSIICAALDDFKNTQASLKPGGWIYDRRECMYKALTSIPGISAVKPSAALYIFPKIDTAMYNIKDDEQFVLDFLREKHVLLTHGRTYNWKQPDHFRVTYIPTMEELLEVMDRFEDFLKGYRQI